MPGYVLYTWGPIPFETYPLTLNEVQHVTNTDWARKEIAGATIYREWVGENEEEVHFRGRVFPHFFTTAAQRGAEPQQGTTFGTRGNPATRGGLGHLDVMDNMRRLGHAHALVRGDGWHLGWFVIERLMRQHAFLERDGIGQQISFEVSFQRVPVPNDPQAHFPALWGQIG